MPIFSALSGFSSNVQQCDNLIANSHGADPITGNYLLPTLDREQITVAAFLNMFIAWESFLETIIASFLSGSPKINGRLPVKFAAPSSPEAAKVMLIGTQRFFDYANHQNLKKVVSIYFANGDPFQPHLDSVYSDLDDLRTMRNASAHITSTTQTALDALATRLFANPTSGIALYQLLTANDPRTPLGQTIFQYYTYSKA